MAEDIEAWRKRQKQQKMCFIGTVQLGHVSKTADWDGILDWMQIKAFEQHWQKLLEMPNVQIARGQIEACPQTNRLHIQFGVKFSEVTRGQTFSNRWACWNDVAKNELAVLTYAKKKSSRVSELPNKGEIKKRKKSQDGFGSPKDMALKWLSEGMTPAEICAMSPRVFFTHHRAIEETYKMIRSLPAEQKEVMRAGLSSEEE